MYDNTSCANLDVSTSFKRLQAEKAAADAILRELTPLETISDSQALRDFVQNVVLKSEVRLHHKQTIRINVFPRFRWERSRV